MKVKAVIPQSESADFWLPGELIEFIYSDGYEGMGTYAVVLLPNRTFQLFSIKHVFGHGLGEEREL